MATKWYNRARLNRKWRQTAKAIMQAGTEAAVAQSARKTAVKTSTAPYMTDDEIKLVNHWGKPGETGEQDNVHAEPLMEFIEEFNEVSAKLDSGDAFYAADIDYLLGVADEIYELIEDDVQQDALVDAVQHLEELHSALYDYISFDEQYVLWFHALQALKKVTDLARYVVDIPSPDEMLDLDAELLPDEVAGQVAGQLNTNLYDDPVEEAYGNLNDEFYGIRVDPDPYDPQGAYVQQEDYYGNANEEMVKAWHTRDIAGATKHSLSLRQLNTAYNKAYDKIMGANGGWIFASVLFSGLSKWEVDALVEEGLVKRKGNRITLTRLGFERPQWFAYR